MSYKGYLSAQMKYDNMCPPELNDYEDDTESEEDSDSSALEDDDIVDRRAFLEELQRKAIERDYQRFLDHLYNTKDYYYGLEKI